MRFNVMSWLLLLAAMAAWGARASAQDPAPADRLERAAVINDARAITPQAYPNAEDVLVNDLIRARYNPDGTSVTTDDTYTKVLTEKGRRENQSLSFHFTIPYSRVTVTLVEVIKPDGAIIPVDIAAQSRVMTDRSQMKSNIYNPNSRILHVGVPGVETGDLVHYHVVRETVKPRVPGTWSDYMVLEYTSPIRRFEYQVSAPEKLPLRTIALRDEIKGTVEHTSSGKEGRRHYRWVVANVPRAHREPDMPPLHTVAQRLLVSTIADWRDISTWYWRLCEPHLEPTPAMRKTVADLTKDLTDPQKKIEAVFRFVSQEIRYMGITTEKEAPGYEPHDAGETFAKKYGVCRDKATLLVAMLRLAGIEAYPTLIHNGPRKDPGVPQPYFNHAIVAARNPAGGYQLMDATDENTRDLFPAYLANQSYLVARPDGETLLTSPIVPAEQNLVRIQTRGTLGPAGDLVAECVLHFDGVNDGAYRGHFARIKPDERARFFQGMAKLVVPGARLKTFVIQPRDLRDTSAPLVVRMKLQAPDIAVSDGGTLMLRVPRFGTHVGLVNFLLRKTGLKKRRFPLETGFACGVEETLTLETDPAFGRLVSMPGFESVAGDAIAFSQDLRADGNRLTGHSRFLLKVTEFTPRQYLALKDALKTLEFNARKMPIFAVDAPAAESDVEILNAEIVYDLMDAHNWSELSTVRKRILTYAGKKVHAEIKLDYNPAWETLTLEKAAVTGRDGKTKAVSPQEQNIMDAEWVGAAPRYPAAKTLVVSLPGVDVGSVIEYRVRRVKSNQPFFAARAAFSGFDPVRWQRVVVEAPSRLSLAIDTRMADALRASQSSFPIARTRRRWLAVAQPGSKKERSLPPWWSRVPSLSVSAGEWRAYARAVRKALCRAARGQRVATLRASALTAGLSGAEAKARAIRDFVATSVRLAGPPLHELPLSAATPADRTLNEGYGNTSDRAVVLYAMLRAAGLRPAFVLASPARVVQGLRPPLLTSPAAPDFATVLVRAPCEGGWVYLNDTDQYAAMGATPHDGCYGLILKSGRIETIRAPADKSDRSETLFCVTLSANGNAAILKRTRYYGAAFAAFHRKFAEMIPEERARYHQQAVARIAQAAEPDGELETRLDAYPAEETFSVTVNRFAVREGDRLYFRLPGSLANLLRLRADTRQNPLYWPRPRRVAVRTIVILPPEFDQVVLRPPPVVWSAPNGAGTVSVNWRLLTRRTDVLPEKISASLEQNEGRAYLLEQSAVLAPAVLPAADYDELLTLQRRLDHPNARTILVRKRPNKF